MGPNGLVGALWRRRLLALVVLVAVLALSLWVAARTPRAYTSVGVLHATAAASTPVDLAELARTARDAGVVDAVRRDLADDAGVNRSPQALRDAIEAAPTADGLRLGVTDRDPEVAALATRLLMDAVQVQGPAPAPVRYTVADLPRVPPTYDRPGSGPVLVTGLLLGLLLACGLALLRDRRATTVDDAAVAEELAGAPLLGHVRLRGDLTDLPALTRGTVDSDDFVRLGEALATQVGDAPSGIVVVAGLGGVETHVWVGANLAVELARRGREVLLVDGRLSCPVGPDGPDGPGLSEVLDGASLDDALVPGPVHGLSVLPARRSESPADSRVLVPPDATAAATVTASPPREASREAPDERDLGPVLDRAASRFDVVLVLPPPGEPAAQARSYTEGASVLLTVPEGAVRGARLRRYAEDIRTTGVRLLGVVLVGGPATGVR